MAVVMKLKWVEDGEVEVGKFAAAQGEIHTTSHTTPHFTLVLSGFLQTFGAMGVAVSTLVSYPGR